jgi:hypothetical protein
MYGVVKSQRGSLFSIFTKGPERKQKGSAVKRESSFLFSTIIYPNLSLILASLSSLCEEKKKKKKRCDYKEITGFFLGGGRVLEEKSKIKNGQRI